MKTLALQPFLALLIIMQLLSSCRSSKTAATTRTQTTAATVQQLDSMHARSSHVTRTTTTVTVLPAEAAAQAPDLAALSLPKAADLAALLQDRGAATLIITQETETRTDSASIRATCHQADTLTTSTAQDHETTAPQPRASPPATRLTWLILSLCLLLILWRRTGHQ